MTLELVNILQLPYYEKADAERSPHSSPVADVVFVHGLQGHPYKTWLFDGKIQQKIWNGDAKPSRRMGIFTTKPEPWRTDYVQRTIFWPGDLLPVDIPDVRIFTFGYDSQITHGFHGPASKSNISQHGLTLLNAVSNVRRDCPDRPLIFIAHSLGGLLVKQALIESEKAARDGQERNLHAACTSVVFFGTPHRESSDASWGVILANIAKAAQFDVNKSILNDLDPSSNSPTLEALQDDFNGLAVRESIKIYTFQEAAGKIASNALSGQVVLKLSSSFNFRAFETRDIINRNHMEICRFHGRDDDGYHKTLGALRQSLTFSVRKMKQTELEDPEQAERRREGLLEKLDFAERSARAEQIENVDAQLSTVEWIWHVEGHRSSFKEWLQNDEQIYWIQGKPGSGKSTLMHYLSRHAKNEVMHLLDYSSQRTWEIIDFLFDFRADHSVANNLEGLLRSLCIQIASSVTGASVNTEELASRERGLSWTLPKLKQTISGLIQQSTKNLCVFVDGLDEYSGKMIELLDFLNSLGQQSTAQKMLKLCFASRPEPVIVMTLESLPGFNMLDHNYKGIEKYVLTAIGKLELASSDESQLLELTSHIVHRADGIFLWVRFALSELIESHAAGETSDELELRLASLPPSMEELYAQIFKRMEAQDRDDARLLCQLVCCQSMDTYTIRQIKEAYAVATQRFEQWDIWGPGGSLEQFRKRLRAKTGGLIEEIPHRRDYENADAKVVKTIHRSVDNFLETRGWLKEPTINGQKFGSLEALWLHVCCTYLKSVLGKGYSTHETHGQGTEGMPHWVNTG